MKEKAILVIDMPKSCEKCDYRFIGNDNSSYCGLTKTFMNRKTDVTKDIDVCCPLKPMPLKRKSMVEWVKDINEDHSLISTHELTDYDKGWNDCVNFLEGEENEIL